MKRSVHRPLLFACVGGLSLILLLALGRKLFPAADAAPVAVGEFSLPGIERWQRKTFSSPKLQLVSYSQQRGSDELFIRFSTLKSPDTPQKTVQDLQEEATKSHHEMAAQMLKLKRKLRWSPPQLVSFGGIAAVKTHSVTFEKSQTQYVDQWRFIKSSHEYFLTSIITISPVASSTPPPRYQSESEQAIEQIAASLNPR